MIRHLLLSALLSCPIALTAAETVRIAVVDLTEINQIVESVVHAKPENAAAVREIADIEAKIALVNGDPAQPPEERRASVAQLAPLFQRKAHLERILAGQVKAMVVAAARQAFGDRYQLIIDRDAMAMILDKPAGVELVDVSLDLQNALLAQPAK
ncbi:MAG: hypothetical protein RLZZ127_1940 [Planctomycetota bacterium]|jgi:hypothetical protein